ncbi:unnamed protein product [Polarella glacialis]|uniref:EF-hand domain-containing protein n=1 Tax=Polarella glacialis TaxID=89957 RepID=A0A813GA49_POLGL|nr:unnamed protein product [Polarella glacialis]
MSAAKQMAAAVSTDAGQAELKALFDKLDTNADGKVSSQEWGNSVFENKDILAKFFGGSSSPEELALAFKRIDVDKSDNLTWAEFTAAARSVMVSDQMAAAMLNPEGKTAIKGLFDKIDQNGDIQITALEFAAALFSQSDIVKSYFGGMDLTLEDLSTAFQRIHKDRNGVLTWNEFESSTASYRVAEQLAEAMTTDTGKAELRALFVTLDKNRDGKVSSQEWGVAVMANKDILQKFFGGATDEEVAQAELWTLRVKFAQAFIRIDVDKSDFLTWDQFETAAMLGA